ncbi:MAG: hypothetical protein HFI33_01230 [Lachnospiraceae bacterium]|nr:hypothetical protein [Lachnospiraceae bacterium]
MRKTKKTAARIQSLIACLVFFVSVFFSVQMRVEAASYLLTPYCFQGNLSGKVFFNGLDGPFYSNTVSLFTPNVSLEVYQAGFRKGAGDVYESVNSNYSYYAHEHVFSLYFRPPSDIPAGAYYTLLYDIALHVDITFPENIEYRYIYIEPYGSTADLFTSYYLDNKFFLSPVHNYAFCNDSLQTFTFKVGLGYRRFTSGSAHPASGLYTTFSFDLSDSFNNVKGYAPGHISLGTSDSYTDGYINNNMGSTSSSLDSSLSGYGNAEDSLFKSSNEAVGAFQMQSLNNPALISSMSFTSTLLQSIWTAAGGVNGFGLVPAVVFTFTFAAIIVGLYRYYGGGKGG